MYDILALISGLAISVMVSINGNLSQQFGIFTATVIVHGVGTVFAFLLCRFQKKSVSLKIKSPRWIYLGGAMGVLTVVFNNTAFGKISMTSIVALGLLGQTVSSLLIDCFGLFGMKKRSFQKSILPGLFFSAAGIFIMTDYFTGLTVIPVFLSLASGVTVVLSRTVNSRLAEKTGEMQSSLINHLVGFLVSLAVTVLMMKAMPPAHIQVENVKPWMFTGGMLGVTAVYICNIIVPKLPAFRLTLLTFVAQVFTGIVIDLGGAGTYSETTFTGGILVSCGMLLSLLCGRIGGYLEKRRERKKKNK